jgi:hypothetical protein
MRKLLRFALLGSDEYQLNDPAAACPICLDVLRSLLRLHGLVNVRDVADLVISYCKKDVLLPLELDGDLAVEVRLVCLLLRRRLRL